MCDRISKTDSDRPEQVCFLLAEALEQEPQLKEMMEGDGDGGNHSWSYLTSIIAEDLTRNVGGARWGVLIAPGKLMSFAQFIRQQVTPASFAV